MADIAPSQQLVHHQHATAFNISPHPYDQLEFDLHNIQSTPRPDKQGSAAFAVSALPTPPRSSSKTVFPSQANPAALSELLPMHALQENENAQALQARVQAMDPLSNPLHTSNVYINGLPPNCREEDLYNLVAQFGKVLSVKTFTRTLTDKPSGYGFVFFERIEDAENCIRSLRRFKDLHPSFSKQSHKIPVPARPAAPLYGQLDGGFSGIGSLPGLANLNLNLAALNVSAHMPDLSTVPEPQPCDLYIEGLPVLLEPAKMLEALVAPYPVVQYRVLQTVDADPPGHIAFVRLASVDAARDTIQRLDGQAIRGFTDKLIVKFANSSTTNPLSCALNQRDSFTTPHSEPTELIMSPLASQHSFSHSFHSQPQTPSTFQSLPQPAPNSARLAFLRACQEAAATSTAVVPPSLAMKVSAASPPAPAPVPAPALRQRQASAPAGLRTVGGLPAMPNAPQHPHPWEPALGSIRASVAAAQQRGLPPRIADGFAAWNAQRAPPPVDQAPSRLSASTGSASCTWATSASADELAALDVEALLNRNPALLRAALDLQMQLQARTQPAPLSQLHARAQPPAVADEHTWDSAGPGPGTGGRLSPVTAAAAQLHAAPYIAPRRPGLSGVPIRAPPPDPAPPTQPARDAGGSPARAADKQQRSSP